jgi:hypothetical protein
MRQQEKVVLVDYLVSAFAGKVVFDEFCNFRPWGRQRAKSDTPTFKFNLFLWREEVPLGIQDDMFVAEQASAISRETRNLCYILFCNGDSNPLNNGVISLEILSKLQNLLLIKPMESLKITEPSCPQKNLIGFWIQF